MKTINKTLSTALFAAALAGGPGLPAAAQMHSGGHGAMEAAMGSDVEATLGDLTLTGQLYLRHAAELSGRGRLPDHRQRRRYR